MPDQIKWGIIGNANISRACVLPAIQASRNGTVIALGTQHPHAAAALAEKHQIPNIYDSYEAVIQDPSVEAVYIPLPNHLHFPWTLKALEAGKHVLCEKPLALNETEAEQMAAAAQSCNLLLMEALMYRFHPRSLQIKHLVDTGKIGRLRHVHSAFCFCMNEDQFMVSDNFRLDPDTGGGALWDVGCYCVSLTRWIMGEEPSHVQGEAVFSSRGVDIQFNGILRFPDGRMATFEAGFVSALQQTFTVSGDAGIIELPHDAFIPWERDARYTIRGVEDESGKVHVVPGADEYQLMVEHFSDAIHKSVSLSNPPQKSIHNMRALDALLRSAREGTRIAL